MAYVTLTKEQFEALLPNDHTIVDHTDAKEYVYQLPTSKANVAVRIYSTVDVRTNTTRDKGSDAIRVVFWDTANNRPVDKGTKILRVEGATTIGQRIQERIADYLLKAADVNIVDFGYVKALLKEESKRGSQFIMGLCDQAIARGSLSDKQLAYVLGDKSPKGYPTVEANVLKRMPTFKERYANGDFNVVGIAGGRTEDDRGKQFISHGTKTTTTTAKGSSTTTTTERNLGVPKEVDDSKTFPTERYTWHQYPFARFNPVQSAVLRYAARPDINLVIGANTSAGKTVCAELAMDFTLSLTERNRVIYLSPLKSLTQEKYDDWQKRFPNEEICILTGDYTLSEAMKAKLARSRIIVMTSEMADSRTRRMKSERNFWLMQVGLVVVDESHIISTDRGHAVESGLMRFTKLNPDARIMLLSATMPNVNELAEWLTKLNGKKTEVVYSTWRPVELQKFFVEHEQPISGWSGRPDYWATQESKRQLAIDIVTGVHPLAQGKENEKFLVFCHDKGTGRNIVKRLNDAGVTAHFHNADLDLTDRLELESSFTAREGGERVLVSTSTLAWGRNLPARNVVIVGVHRGLQKVDELDIIQMAGRAGRYGIDDAGFVYLICPPMTTKEWQHKFENPRPVNSVLNHRPTLAFHVLADIESQDIGGLDDLFYWYKRSLAGHQQLTPFEMEDAKLLLDELKAMEMIEDRGNYMGPYCTGLGKVSAWLYYSPYDVNAWHHNFKKVINDLDDITLAWAVCDIPSNDWGYVPKDVDVESTEWAFKLRNRGVQPSSAIGFVVAAYHSLQGTKCKGTLAAMQRTTVYDIRRIAQAITLIDKMYAKWDKEDLWGILPNRIMYGVPAEAVELTRLTGVGGATARKLYEAGITSLAMVASDDYKSLLRKVVPPAKARNMQIEANKLISG